MPRLRLPNRVRKTSHRVHNKVHRAARSKTARRISKTLTSKK